MVLVKFGNQVLTPPPRLWHTMEDIGSSWKEQKGKTRFCLSCACLGHLPTRNTSLTFNNERTFPRLEASKKEQHRGETSMNRLPSIVTCDAHEGGWSRSSPSSNGASRNSNRHLFHCFHALSSDLFLNEELEETKWILLIIAQVHDSLMKTYYFKCDQ